MKNNIGHQRAEDSSELDRENILLDSKGNKTADRSQSTFYIILKRLIKWKEDTFSRPLVKIDQLLPTSVHNLEEAAIVCQCQSPCSSRCPYLAEGKIQLFHCLGRYFTIMERSDRFQSSFQRI